MYGLVIERFCVVYLIRVLFLILFSEHRVPSGKASRCLFQDLFYLIRDVLLVDYQTEHILIKPLVCHDEVAGVRPGPQLFSTIHFFGFPFALRSTAIKVMACEETAGECLDTLFLSMPKVIPISEP